MGTMWFNRRPGDFAAESAEDPTMSLIGDGPPDWVRMPPEIGTRQLRVLNSVQAPCPMCSDGRPVRHLLLEDNYGVAECTVHGFAWYRLR